MGPLLTRGLGPVARIVSVGFGPDVAIVEEDTAVRKRFGGSRARRRFEYLTPEKNKKYDPGKAPYDAFTVGASLVSVNNKKVDNVKKMSKVTKAIYYEDVSISIIDVRNSSSNPFYKIFIECTGLKKRAYNE